MQITPSVIENGKIALTSATCFTRKALCSLSVSSLIYITYLTLQKLHADYSDALSEIDSSCVTFILKPSTKIYLQLIEVVNKHHVAS